MRIHDLSPLPFIALILAAPVAAQAQSDAPVVAQPDDQPEEPDLEDEDTATIIVQGTRIRGQLIVDEPPIAEYDEADIAALGAGSIEDLLEAIAPDTQSNARGSRGGGRPVFLINGLRVSSFREFRSYPPEAIAKLEVFPESVAQRFGYSPDQRVVNIVLKPNFRAVTAEVEYGQPGSGGYSRNEQDVTYLRIAEAGRLNFTVDVEDSSLLTEAERGLAVAGEEDAAPFRSLLPDTFGLEATANYARAFIDSGTSLSLNATYERAQTRSLSGLGADGLSALERRGSTDSLSLGGSVNRRLGDWTATLTSDGVYEESETEIDRRAGDGFDIARSRVTTLVNKATLVGYPIDLPAGEVTTTLDLGLDWKNYRSNDSRADTVLDLTRRRLAGGVNLSIPVARRGGHWGALGSVNVNLSGGAEDLSDFGTLPNWTAGLNWQPTEALSLSATRIWRKVAPGLTDLGRPRVDEFNVPVFDYLTGNTALATIITGGNPGLLAETQADWQFAANWKLPFWDDARLQADYGINRSRNVTFTPGFSAAFETAFPDRVTRDADGSLLTIDRRPLTLFGTRSRILSFGLSARGQIGKAPERPAGREARRGGDGAGGVPNPFARGRDDGDRRPRYFASLNHTLTLDNEIELAATGPVFDQLDGQLLGNTTVPRHSTQVEGGLFLRGYGFRVSARYTGEATIRGFDGAGQGDLFFGDLATVDLRLFAELDEVLKREDGWLEDLRLSLVVDNLFDAQRRVTDASGVTPEAYDPRRLDPVGRYFGIDLRKAF
ncbi:hypothetical protein [Qipengyuania sp.]|uniref:hypothetical protein n=1 Tax=Qipengyuania sp. TaxID=2004515 RepID=UPI003734D69F